MIELLRKIGLQVADAPDLATALNITVNGVRDAMEVDACSVYLIDPNDDCLVLMESAGLNRSAIGEVRLAPGQGITNLPREGRIPVELEDASEHPRYKYFAGTGEAQYRAFLGVPVIHYRKVIGVLTVQQKENRSFNDAHKDFLVTASAQLAGILAGAISLSPNLFVSTQTRRAPYIQGVAGATGVAIGTIVLHSPLEDLDAVPDRTTDDPQLEESAFRDAISAVQAKLLMNRERMKELLPSETHALFDVYTLMVGDDSLAARVIARIHQGQWAPAALRDAIRELSGEFEAIDDERLRARAEDVRAVGHQLLHELQVDRRSTGEFPRQSILLGDEISLDRIVSVPRERLAGIACFKGSMLSHTAIIAHALGIPAVMGLGDIPAKKLNGRTIIVDGFEGRVFIDPPPAIMEEFTRHVHEEQAISDELASLRMLPAETKDGERVSLHVNSGLLTDIQPSREAGAEGVGLYRSEFPFMLRETFPSEDQQFSIYRKVLEAFAPQPVVMRTLDIGGDKVLPYFPIDEANSLLGWRGIRVTLQHPEIFIAQLRTMLRANAGLGNLQLLLPMVSVAAEVREARGLLDSVVNSLREEGLDFELPPLGIMIEVPATIFELQELAQLADFFSIGSNDLTQYLLAVDRGNPRVAELYDHLQPSVLKAIRQIAGEVHRLGKPLSVCGEMAGDPLGAIMLVAMGIDHLSMAAAAIPRIKWVIRSISKQHAVRLLEEVLLLPDAAAARKLIREVLEDAGLGSILHAGR